MSPGNSVSISLVPGLQMSNCIQLFYVGSGDWTQVLTLAQWAFSPPRLLHGLLFILKNLPCFSGPDIVFLGGTHDFSVTAWQRRQQRKCTQPWQARGIWQEAELEMFALSTHHGPIGASRLTYSAWASLLWTHEIWDLSRPSSEEHSGYMRVLLIIM